MRLVSFVLISETVLVVCQPAASDHDTGCSFAMARYICSRKRLLRSENDTSSVLVISKFGQSSVFDSFASRIAEAVNPGADVMTIDSVQW